MKKEILLILGFIFIVLIVFIPEIVFFKKGFLGGDYGQQFYPYSFWYAQAIKNFKLPFYTQLIGSGYPLIAEGQSGIFYPFNLLLFFFLPVKIAYQLNTILHFLLGGLFSYLFIRNKKLSVYSSLIFALIFMFGANVCGIRYNTVVQKVLVWLPLAFLLIDKYFVSRKNKYLFSLSLVFLLQIFAGFLQIAFYCIGFSLLYFLVKLFNTKVTKLKIGVCLAGFLIPVFMLSLIQLIPTLRFASFSTRVGQDVGFSLWGSSTPLVFLTLIFPKWDFLLEGNLYTGIILIPFIFLFLKYFRKAPQDFKIYFFLFLFSLILALGKYLPVLPFLIKFLHLEFIRKPSKFLFLSNFFLSICIVWSVDNYFKSGSFKKDRVFMLKVCLLLLFIVLVIFLVGNLILMVFGDELLNWGKSYVEKNIYAKSYHRYSLEVYYKKLKSMFRTLKDMLSLRNKYNIISFLLLSGATISFLFRKHLKKILFGFLLLELFIFSQYATGLKGNFLSWDKFLKVPGYVRFLKNDKGDFRIYNFITSRTEPLFFKNYALIENRNLIYGISSIGIYAPIVDKDYYQLLKELAAVDDSLGRIATNKTNLKQNLGLLSFLNVKYIISFENLDDFPQLQRLYSEGNIKIYQLKNFMPRMFFAKAVKRVKSREELLGILKSESYSPFQYLLTHSPELKVERILSPQRGKIEIQTENDDRIMVNLEVDRTSLLVISNYYRGWGAFLDGKEVTIYPVNLVFQGIIIPAGRHRLKLRYNAYF